VVIVKILVTGGAGFIGSNFVRRTIEGAYPSLVGAEVVVYDALTYSGNLENLLPVSESERFSFVHGDIRDAAKLAEAMPGVDAVVHFAAESHVDRSVLDSSIFVETNVLGTQRVLDAALTAHVAKVVHVSTDEVYGSIAEGSWTEDRLLEPNSPYSASKAGSDLIARSYVRTHGLDVSITRCSNNYGLHVDDHTRAISLVLADGRAGEIYNIGGGRELDNTELTHLLLEATGRDSSFIDHVPDRKGHDLRYSVDYSKIQNELGYEPLIGFEGGLEGVVRWYRDNRSWWEPLKARAALG